MYFKLNGMSPTNTSGNYISRISCMQGERTSLTQSGLSVPSTQKTLIWRLVAFGNDFWWHSGHGRLNVQVSKSHKIRRERWKYSSGKRDHPVAEAATYTTHNKHTRRIPLPSAGFEAASPAIKRFQTYTLHRTATGIGHLEKRVIEFHDQSLQSLCSWKDERCSTRVCNTWQTILFRNREKKHHFGGFQASPTLPSDRSLMKIKMLERKKHWFEIGPVEFRFTG